MCISKHFSSTFRRQAPALRQRRTTVARLILRAVQRWQRNRAMAALEGLDDRTLEDIGIARNEIPQLAESFFRRSEHGRWSSVATHPPIDRQFQRPV
ncbi:MULTISPECIES: DUF1127 domain-containing protein [unclassified Mesorhizobium]|uniref:DUF1127 domain-containing protein n=1 Tax=unclassified Mesorhizobium TaxID=325217 RepID=UPI00112D5D25|nr:MULTISPECIES: DUF1127 domain-containing protein [unclassified Mesorhizobium]MBZ9811058.1 DUF1127 domain-containing protein [Mesorhizobium sp. ESP-6-2]TPM27823.1 DUF1127 domain-containing protein [Mesorhizobium sp. B2-2-2]